MAPDLTSLPRTSLPGVLNCCGVPVVKPLLDAIVEFVASRTAEIGAKTILPALLAGPGMEPGLLKNMGISKHRAIVAKRHGATLLKGTGLGRVTKGHIGPNWVPKIQKVSLFVHQSAHSTQIPFNCHQLKVNGVYKSWHFLNTTVCRLYAFHQATEGSRQRVTEHSTESWLPYGGSRGTNLLHKDSYAVVHIICP